MKKLLFLAFFWLLLAFNEAEANNEVAEAANEVESSPPKWLKDANQMRRLYVEPPGKRVS